MKRGMVRSQSMRRSLVSMIQRSMSLMYQERSTKKKKKRKRKKRKNWRYSPFKNPKNE